MRLNTQIEEETEKARKRAERFGAEFTEPNVELILDQDELYLYRKITDPDSLKASKGPRVQYRSQVRPHAATSTDICSAPQVNGVHRSISRADVKQRIDGGLLDGAHEIRDRDYTQQLLEKVAAAQRAARARAERFGVEYVEPKLNVILSREEYRKYMSATGGRNPLMLETAPVAGSPLLSQAPSLPPVPSHSLSLLVCLSVRLCMHARSLSLTLMPEMALFTGIDTTTEDEKARIQARADRFKAASGTQDGDEEAVAAVAARAAAEAELQEREVRVHPFPACTAFSN